MVPAGNFSNAFSIPDSKALPAWFSVMAFPTSNIAIGPCPLSTAKCRAVSSFSSSRSCAAPPSSRRTTISSHPLQAALDNAVCLERSFRSTLAPFSSRSSFTMCKWLFSAAQCSAVLPNPSCRSTPVASTRVFTISSWPCSAAQCNATLP
ncbi:hypothetical protein F4782DRAFT_514256 [Xylaria castorea]|nr:hypothetical protein F4782DRAFT_514256 [Xylaria castorea]